MGATNYGDQDLTWYYQHQATGDEFNQALRDIIKPGITKGGLITIVGLNDIQVSPMIAYLRSNDVPQNKGVHMQTKQLVTMAVPNAPNQQYIIYLTYTYLPNLTNYVDFNIRTIISPPVTNEIKVGKVTNDGAGNLISIEYYNSITSTYYRDFGGIDADNSDNLTTSVIPTQDYHVGNRLFNDYRYVNHNGTNNWDVQIRKSADGTLSTSRIWFDGASAQEWELQDRTGKLALHYETLRLGMIIPSVLEITPSADDPFLDISQNWTLNSTGAGSWPDLVPALLAQKTKYTDGTDNFPITAYSEITPGAVARLQFDTAGANGIKNTHLLMGLLDDNLFHANSDTPSYVNWKCLTLASAANDIPAGDYEIVSIDLILLTVDIATAVTTSAGSCAVDVNVYPYRIGDPTGISSTTQCRWYRVSDAAMVSNGITQTDPLIQTTYGGDYMNMPGMRLRDRSNMHDHQAHAHNYVDRWLATPGDGTAGSVFIGPFVIGWIYEGKTTTYGTAGPNTENLWGAAAGTYQTHDSRIGSMNRTRSFGTFFYMFGKTYTP